MSVRLPLCLVLAAALAGCTPALDWREVRPDGSGGLSALFPCKPTSHARMVALAGARIRTTLVACSAGGTTWGIAFADVQDPARVGQALTELRAAAAGNLAAGALRPIAGTIAGATPNDAAGRFAADGRFPDGRGARMEVAVFARGTTVVQATALGERLQPEAIETFFAALRLTS